MKITKKILSLTLAMLMLISCVVFVGCNEHPTTTEPPLTTTQPPQTTTDPNQSELEWPIDDFVSGQVLVLLTEEASDPDKVFGVEFFEGVAVKEVIDYSFPTAATAEHFQQFLLLILCEDTKEAVLRAIPIIEQIDGVYAADPNYIRTIELAANDTYYDDDDDDDEYDYQWALQNIDVENVWDFSTGSEKVRVGILDTGIDSHEDLNNNYSINDALDFSSVLNDSDNPTQSKEDLNGHGTHVAGIIGAVGNNSVGISGVNWKVTLVELRSVGFSNTDIALICAIKYATDSLSTSNAITILNLSAGGYSASSSLESVIRDYTNAGGLFVCSTGNLKNDNDTTHHYPSYYASSLYSNPISNMITVGRTDSSNNRPNNANWGANTISIYAPGQNIISTFPTDLCSRYESLCSSTHNGYGYHALSGSSMSTPHVTGVAALLLSINPDLTAAQLKDCILSGADSIEISTLSGDQIVKKLNAWGAFKYMMNNYIPSYRLGTTTTEISLETDRLSSYYLESHPTAKIVIPYSQTFTFTAVSTENAIDAVLYDSDMNPISISKTFSNGNKTVSLTNELAAGTYYLSTYYTSTGTHDIDVTISHTHEYTGYARYSSQYHVGCCACGATNSNRGVHVCRASDEDAGDRFYTCILCGAAMDSEMGGPGMIIHAIQKVSINGSYILSDGTVFLVDEDIDAYFEGTLVFYDPDKLPQVE